MRSNRTLALRRETLTELHRSDLSSVAGGTVSRWACVEPTSVQHCVASIQVRTCFALSLDCYSWHTEEC